jgi:hypothetical protein
VTVIRDSKLYEVYGSRLLGDVLVNLEEYEILIPAHSALWLLRVLQQDAKHVAHVMDALEADVDPAGAWVWNIEYEGPLFGWRC